MHSNRPDRHDEALDALLKEYPAPEPRDGFFDQALARATHEGSRRQRNRWLMTGAGSVIAAGLVLWLIGGLFFTTQTPVPVEPEIPGITMTLDEPRTVRLVFASGEALENASLTVVLPEGIELAGFPGQREITWRTSLDAGKNLLPLELIATSPLGGEVLARIEHNNRNRTFRLRIEVS